MAGPGRPSKLTAQVRTVLVEAIEKALPVTKACDLAGIHEGTFYSWLSKGQRVDARKEYAEFSREIARARARAQERLVDVIQIAALEPKNWRAAAWLLERQYPADWAETLNVRLNEELSAKLGEFLRACRERFDADTYDELVDVAESLADGDSGGRGGRSGARLHDPRDVDFYGFVPKVSPNLDEPRHLAGLVDAMRDAFLASAGHGPPVFACVSVPPQHGKTETILHAMACWLTHRPGDSLAYISYNSDISRDKSRRARDYARIAGVELRDDSRSVETWTTTANGGLMARGILGGAITGQPGLRLIVIDDPFKNRAEAESRTIRDRVWAEFQSAIVSRLHPTTSVIINHTRWHPDDLQGRALRHDPEQWKHINLPAIDEAGAPLWPKGQPLDLLEEKRKAGGEYEWASLYMGEPRPRDTQLFQGVSYYESTPPLSRMRIGLGVDFAYTSKTSSDWNVAVVMGRKGDEYYVLDVVRRQCAAPAWAEELERLQRRWAGAPTLAYIGGTERGTIDLMTSEFGLRLRAEPATKDKFLRAQPLSAAWNAGRVHVPAEERSWRQPFLDTLLDFTGVSDPHDDDVDAAAAAFDALQSTEHPVYLPEDREFASRGEGARDVGSWGRQRSRGMGIRGWRNAW